MVGTDRLQRLQIRAGALHREQAFAQHQQPVPRLLPASLVEAPLQIGKIVVGETVQPGAASLHPRQQGVVDQSVGQHQGVTVR